MVWVWEPPSDQDRNVLEPWGDGAEITRWMFSTPTTTRGATKGCPSRVSCSPVGLVAKVIVVVRGRMSRMTSVVRPTESSTTRWIRYQTLAEVSPTVGIVNVPDVDPVVGCTKGWKCVS